MKGIDTTPRCRWCGSKCRRRSNTEFWRRTEEDCPESREALQARTNLRVTQFSKGPVYVKAVLWDGETYMDPVTHRSTTTPLWCSLRCAARYGDVALKMKLDA